MARVSRFGDADIEQYLHRHRHQSLLRVIACGSVAAGKSTLTERLLYESQMILADQFAAPETDSKKAGTRGGDIDVAYRFFSTARRNFIVADPPGHEQYTRNMVTGASTADLAIILIDAREGVQIQTRRHSYLVSLLGIRRVVVAINKMDLTGYSQAVCDRIESAYREFASRVGLTDVTCIPMSALNGDNVITPGTNMPWYTGPTLMQHLEQVPVENEAEAGPFRLSVQWVNRPNLAVHGLAGQVLSGSVRIGDNVQALPSGRQSRVKQILVGDVEADTAHSGQSITITLVDEIEVSRGDVLAPVDAPPSVADQFEATIVWMHEDPMLQSRTYLLKIGTQTVTATVAPLKYKVNVDTLEHIAAKTLELNDIGVCGLELGRPVVFEPYAENRDLGGFILIDRITNATVGAGLLHFALRRSQNVHWQAVDVNKEARSTIKAQKPCVLWLTGLSGAGKSTIANAVERRLHALGRHTYMLDGDNVRHGLSKDLGFTDADRVENIRRVAEVARLMVDAGLIVLVSFISPFRAERLMARSLVEDGEFVEVFVDTPLQIAERRDPKGLYKKARRGELKNFTGVDSPYEPPHEPEIHINTLLMTPDQAAETILEQLRKADMI